MALPRRPTSTLTTLVLSAVFAATALGAVAKPVRPQPWLKTKVDEAQKLATRKVEPGTEAEAKWQDDAKAMIDELLDWDELTRRALGGQWNERSDKERQRFSRLLREMIEASYRDKLRMATRGDLKKPKKITIDWLQEDLQKDEATVSAKVTVDKRTAVLEFKLLWKDDRWRAYDLSIDEVSTVRTYRSQFRKLIAEQGWDGLISRMESKIDEIRSGRSALAP